MSIFGTVIDGAMVEESMKTFLGRWLPTYLAELAEQRGLARDTWLKTGANGNWPPTWVDSTAFELSETTRLPAILVISTGLKGAPIREGDGSYRATWLLGIAAVVTARDHGATNRLAKRYGAAIRWLLAQHPSMEDPNVEGITWEDETYGDVPAQQERSLASVRIVVSVEYRHVMNALDGPILPTTPPPDPTVPIAEWATVRDPDSDPPYTPATVTRSL